MSGVRWLIVPAAGKGMRMGSDIPKQYLPLAERTVLECTLTRLYQAWPNAHLILCLADDDEWFSDTMVPPFVAWTRIPGGAERANSVVNGLNAIHAVASPTDWVAVHDVARPCVTCDDLRHLASALHGNRVGGVLAVPVADTMKRAASEEPYVLHTESREGLWHALTPQLFRYDVLYRAMDHANACATKAQQALGHSITDESSAVEALGEHPLLVKGRRDNIKITHPEDLSLVAHVLAAQAAMDK